MSTTIYWHSPLIVPLNLTEIARNSNFECENSCFSNLKTEILFIFHQISCYYLSPEHLLFLYHRTRDNKTSIFTRNTRLFQRLPERNFCETDVTVLHCTVKRENSSHHFIRKAGQQPALSDKFGCIFPKNHYNFTKNWKILLKKVHSQRFENEFDERVD